VSLLGQRYPTSRGLARESASLMHLSCVMSVRSTYLLLLSAWAIESDFSLLVMRWVLHFDGGCPW